MNKSILLAGLASLLIGGGVFVGCSSDSDDGDGNTTDNTGGAGATGGDNTGATSNGGSTSSSTGPGPGGAGPGGAGPGGAGPGGAGPGGAGGGPVQMGCDAPLEAASVGACAVIGDPINCNPVTNAGCEGADACDNSGTSFECFPDATTALYCEACDVAGGVFCNETATCIDGSCARYCCDDGDCGDGTCIKMLDAAPVFDFAPDVGVCF